MYKEHYSLMAPGKCKEKHEKAMKEFINANYYPMINWRNKFKLFVAMLGDRKKYCMSHED